MAGKADEGLGAALVESQEGFEEITGVAALGGPAEVGAVGFEGELEEEQGGAELPGFRQAGAEGEGVVREGDEAAFFQELREADAAFDHMEVEGFVDGEEASGGVKAAVETTEGDFRF